MMGNLNGEPAYILDDNRMVRNTRCIITEEPIPSRPPVKFPCFIEFNKSGTRIRIAFDGADPEGALTLIDEGLPSS